MSQYVEGESVSDYPFGSFEGQGIFGPIYSLRSVLKKELFERRKGIIKCPILAIIEARRRGITGKRLFEIQDIFLSELQKEFPGEANITDQPILNREGLLLFIPERAREQIGRFREIAQCPASTMLEARRQGLPERTLFDCRKHFGGTAATLERGYTELAMRRIKTQGNQENSDSIH